jgi:hypothetical protein
MAKTKFALKALLLIASLGVAQDAAAANLLVNGSFEDPVQGGPLFATFNIPAGSTQITGWTVVQGNVDLTNTCCYARSYAGSQAVDLIGDSNGTSGVFGGLSQTFATTQGQEYRLTFAYSHNNGTYSPDYAVQVTVADANAPGNSVLSAEASQAYYWNWHSQADDVYDLFSQTFVASSSSTILTFMDTRGGFNAGIYLDDVSVEVVTAAVPEPSTWAMMVLGFTGVGFMTYRRRKPAALAA